MTPKDIHNFIILKKIFIFLKTPKNVEIQNFEPQKMVQAYIYLKISEYHLPSRFQMTGAYQKDAWMSKQVDLDHADCFISIIALQS